MAPQAQGSERFVRDAWGEKENRRKGITACEQGENVMYSNFLVHRGNGHGVRPGGLDGRSEQGKVGPDASNCIRG
jgi:hypothetical protein